MSPLRSKYVPTQVSPEATARPVSTEGSQARLVSQAWNSEEGQVGFLIYICICICVLLYLYLCNCICICGIVFVELYLYLITCVSSLEQSGGF